MSSLMEGAESDGWRRGGGDMSGGSRSLDLVGRSRTMTLDCTRGGGKIKRWTVWSCCMYSPQQCFP